MNRPPKEAWRRPERLVSFIAHTNADLEKSRDGGFFFFENIIILFSKWFLGTPGTARVLDNPLVVRAHLPDVYPLLSAIMGHKAGEKHGMAGQNYEHEDV